MQVKLPKISLVLLCASLAAAQGCDFCGAGCAAGQACITYDLSVLSVNSGIESVLNDLDIPVPILPGGSTITVRILL